MLATNGLTPKELALVDAGFMLGPSAFLDAGLSVADYMAFLARPEVQVRMKTLGDELRDQNALNKRRQFMAKRQLSLMVPKSLQILRDALDGPKYTTVAGRPLIGSNGRFMVEKPAPTGAQIDAAKDVLNRLNIGTMKKDETAFASLLIRMNYGLEDEKGIRLEYEDGASTEQQRQSRDKMRRAIQLLMPDVAKLLPKVQDETIRALKERGRRAEAKSVKSTVVDKTKPKKKKK